MPDNNLPGISNNMTTAVHGGDVYRNRVRLDFSVNLNPLPLPQVIIEAAQKGLEEMHQYPDPVQSELRNSIASYEGVAADNVICGNGASELILAVCHTLRPGKALITAPCYAGYARALKAIGTEVSEYMLDGSMEFALDERFLCKLNEDIDIVFLADPNNPNGKLTDRDLMKKISDTCAEKNITLVLDECFLPLTERGSCGIEEDDRALHLRAFTKTFAIPGIRIGYMISRDTELLAGISGHLPEWNVSRIAERTGEAAAKVLKDTDYLADSVRVVSEERKYLKQELKNKGFRVYESDANYLLFRGSADLYDKLLEKGILIRKCANFNGLDDTFFRIAVRTHEDNEQLTAALAEIQG